MKRWIQNIYSINWIQQTAIKVIILHCIIVQVLTAFTPTPYLSFRSQSENAARELVGLTQHINLAVNHFYGTFALTAEFTQSFFENRIADCLFGRDLLTDTLSAINVTGSGVRKRNRCQDWLADYFGLPRDFNATIKFEPIIQNVIADFYLYLGLNNILCGLYATIHAPIVYTNWDLHFVEVVNKEGFANHPPGYFNQVATGDNVGVPRTDLLKNVTNFMFFEKTPKLGDQVCFSPLTVAKMAPKRCSTNKRKTALSDIQAVVGWNFWLNRRCHLGAGIRAVAPTGNRPNGEFIFEPIVGNGKHWEAGVQLWGHRTLYISENEEKQWLAYFVANITHLFNARQCRVFDLCCKPNSRWMLAERFTNNVQNLRAALLPANLNPGNLSVPIAQFANRFCPVANLTRREVKVSANVQCDIVTMLTYISRNLSVDFGYNVWYRSCEKICKIDCKTPLQTGLWALKGDSYVFGFTKAEGVPPVPDDTPVALSATQSDATIHEGTNNFVGLSGDQAITNGLRPTQNPGIDNRFFAAAVFNGQPVFLNDRIMSENGLQTGTSNPPIFITEDQLDLCSAQTKGLSNKLFFHLNYSWFDYPNECRIPFLGGGFEIEFGKTDVDRCKKNRKGCQLCALSQWGLWLKGGVSFS